MIPVLTIDDRRLVKTTRFKDPRYLGDPLNAVRILNEKEVDEIVVLDIGATRKGKAPDISFIGDLASECFMPMAYGGGITTLDQIARLFELGIEKVVMNTSALEQPALITEAARIYGSQAIVASMDVGRRRWTGRADVAIRGGTRFTGRRPAEVVRALEKAGAGELLVTSIHHDGMMQGYDLDLVEAVAGLVSIPVIACGGAGSLDDLRRAVAAGASAAAAGSLFMYQGKHRAVLVNFPSQETREHLFA